MKINIDFGMILIIIATILFTIGMIAIYSFQNMAITISFQMDNNTLEAIKSINWTAMQNITR